MNLGTVLGIIIFFLAFITVFRKRDRIAMMLIKTKIPKVILFVITASALIWFEEEINCHPVWCWSVIIPPTFFPILFQVIVLGLLFKLSRLRKITLPIIVFIIFGIWLEVSQGGLKDIQFQLSSLFWIFWVSISYMFVAVVPLTIIKPQIK
jgi:hypothetical protein